MSAPYEELAGRWTGLQKAMAAKDFGGLLVYGNQIKSVALYYVTGYTLLGSRAFCYVPPEGKPVLLISEAWDRERAMRESPIGDVRVLGKNGMDELAALCRTYKGAVGIAGREVIGRQDLTTLEAALGRETSSATAMLEELAIIKSPYELEVIREAARMADAGFNRALEVIREGLADYELVAEIDYVMRKMGATDNFQMLAVGKNNTGMLLPFGKKVERGDLLLFEITPANGAETYSAQLCRTAICGEKPEAVLQEKYTLLVRAMQESLAVVKPGVKISEVARIQNEILEKAGYGEYCQPPFMRARGHGFGLGRVDVDDDCPYDFAAGISLVVHPNQFLPETGYLALGEHILVTAEGYERLTRTEARIYECP